MEGLISQHNDSDLQAELAALRQRLSDLEADHRELKRQAARRRRPAFFRKFLLSALPVALLLAGAALLAAQSGRDPLFIDTNGNIRIGGAVGINRDAIPNQQLVIQPKQDYTPFNVTNPAGNVNWLSVFSDGKVIMNGGNVGIGTTDPKYALQISNFAPGDRYITVTTAPGNLYKTGIRLLAKSDYGFTIENDDPKNALNIRRHWADVNGQTALSINAENGNVGIGTTSPSSKLDVAGTLNVSGKATLKDTEISGTLTLPSQKVCSVVDKGNWRDTITVPASWTNDTCQKYKVSVGAVDYQLGCISQNGISFGDWNGGLPSANECGWKP